MTRNTGTALSLISIAILVFATLTTGALTPLALAAIILHREVTR